MSPTFKELTSFFSSIGANDVAHTERGYLAHAIGVHNDLREWGCDEEICRAGMFHSIYGTEFFQKFTLPLDQRHRVRELIGERAERLAYYNCAMDRCSFDEAVKRANPPHQFQDRLTNEEVELSPQDFHDLCTIHLCDWIEQAPRSETRDYRREAYQSLANLLGGVPRERYEQEFSSKATGG